MTKEKVIWYVITQTYMYLTHECWKYDQPHIMHQLLINDLEG